MAWTLLTTGLWVPDRKYNRSYLHNILQRHRYGDHSYECPTNCAYNRQLMARCLDILRHPGKFDPSQPQIGHVLEHE